MAKPPSNFKQTGWTRPGGVGAQPLGEIVPDLIDPLLQKRAGLNSALIGAWAEIAGPLLAHGTRPQKTVWGRANAELDGSGAATLVVAADPSVALRVQHETGPLLARINAFFGQKVIDKIRIVQMPVAKGARQARRPVPGPAEISRAQALAAGVADEALREALARLGAHVIAARTRQR